ncbi:MAG: glycine zipper domain-containing protein [bacterium]|nr:glycine zipper domain-containing protein [Candidatus Sumerlaeota bacterium]
MKILGLFVIAALLAGCSCTPVQQGALMGSLVGGAAGALIGASVTHGTATLKGAGIGAAVGAATGALIADSMSPKPCPPAPCAIPPPMPCKKTIEK